MKVCKLYIDQYGNTLKELRAQIGMGGSRVAKMYRDTKDGTFHTGYVIGSHWLTAYAPVLNKA